MLQILHNPRCGKSRDCLAFLDDSKAQFEIRNYIQDPLSKEELKDLIQKLGIKPIALVRQKETVWIELFKEKKMSNVQIINALVKYPILIERPIVIKGNQAVIGRDLEKLGKFI
ncbi:arsenate reductase (glutaredoxin) [Flavobacterium terrisoli]|uniref:arsenate reductase (glutaredoxin) n=1 Tax=Flavobacterium terrisoli TaxID=3242195 RepID=UPI002543F49D|nr:arsenate reductase (glutaredoxin) [Flavobacterium buctense]